MHLILMDKSKLWLKKKLIQDIILNVNLQKAATERLYGCNAFSGSGFNITPGKRSTFEWLLMKSVDALNDYYYYKK